MGPIIVFGGLVYAYWTYGTAGLILGFILVLGGVMLAARV